MAKDDTTFPDGVHAHFNVGVPWWAFLWGGFLIAPIVGEVTTYTEVRKKVRKWWCLWLCEVTETVRVSHPVEDILIQAVQLVQEAYNGNPPVFESLGTIECSNCSDKALYIIGTGFWPGIGFGSNRPAIGFSANVIESEGVATQLHHLWGIGSASFGWGDYWKDP